MIDYLALPAAREVRGTVNAPPSKSATNRAFALAALSGSAVEIVRPLESDDTEALLRCLEAMGARVKPTERGVLIQGPLSGTADREVVLDARESGTAARFLTALAAAAPGRFLLTGSSRLRERPIRELVAALRSGGARIGFAGEDGHLPLTIVGGALRPGRITVDASRSSQFVSSLLLAGVAVEGGLEVEARGQIVSAPYVVMTVEMLKAFGHRVTAEGVAATTHGAQAGASLKVARGSGPVDRYEVPGDFSSALPLLAAAGVAGGELTVRGLTCPSRDADALALPVMERMGLRVEAGPEGLRASRSRVALRPVTARATHYPDAVPVLAAIAAFAPGQSRFEGIGHLRVKESDRIESLAALLLSAGAKAFAEPENLVVEGPLRERPDGGVRRLPTFGDHRIAIAAALLSLGRPGLLIENPGCVAKSYPRFFQDLESIVVR